MKKMIVLMLIISSHFTYAGSTAKQEAHFPSEAITTFSKSVEKYAASRGAKVFIVARLGRPKSELPKGVDFTHVAIAIYSTISLENGKTAKGYAIHNLYQTAKKPDKSELIMDYPADFFWGAYDLSAGIIIPNTQLQEKILSIYNNGWDKQLHNSEYSLLANPYNARYQNCTEYTLDVINSAIYNTTNYAQLKANTKAYFKADKIKISSLKLMLGQLTMKDLRMNDQHRKIQTATFTGIARYLEENDLLLEAIILKQHGEVESL
ncbi:MAG: DUF2145 domain-containing protein [Cellvibrio sp.]|nr:DUF2145 domain-containing protein [Cellvibrio sp.]